MPALVLGVPAGPPLEFGAFYYIATALAAGVAAALLFVPVEAIGRRFSVLLSLVAVVFLALAVASSALQVGYLHVAVAALLIAYNVLLPAQAGVDLSPRREALGGGPRSALAALAKSVLLAAAACGLAGVAADAWAYPRLPGFAGAQAPWLAAAFVTSSLLLGSSLVAMVLGHWHLVVPRLSFAPLARLTALLLVTLVLRAAAAGGAAWAQGERWSSLASLSDPGGSLLVQGVFLPARGLVGLAAPAVLGWMTWRCVKIRSNQSATGILYVVVVFVLIGEIIAKHLLAEGLVV
ncbi:MAG: hypothetical protein HY721_00235 [Planctomycetes bacterium]|nr:hypothetical protein [Planctomycetota bacterium]